MSEQPVPYVATQPIGTIKTVDIELTPTELGLIRCLRKASNEIVSPFGVKTLTVIIRPKGKRHTWFVGQKEENVQYEPEQFDS